MAKISTPKAKTRSYIDRTLLLGAVFLFVKYPVMWYIKACNIFRLQQLGYVSCEDLEKDKAFWSNSRMKSLARFKEGTLCSDIIPQNLAFLERHILLDFGL